MTSKILAALAVPVSVALAAAADAALLKRLEDYLAASPAMLMASFVAIGRMAASVPALVHAERVSLGMGADPQIEEPLREDGLAQRIVADEDATQLAIQLLARLAETR